MSKKGGMEKKLRRGKAFGGRTQQRRRVGGNLTKEGQIKNARGPEDTRTCCGKARWSSLKNTRTKSV